MTEMALFFAPLHDGPRPAVVARRVVAVLALLLATLATAASCRSRSETSSPPSSAAVDRLPAALAGEPPARPRVVVLGDSLAAGYGLPAEEAFPALLQRKVDELGYDYEVVNMGVSGDTSAGGLSRADWALEGDVSVLVVALGGNDALRGLSPADMARNLGAIVDKARARSVAVLLCGMEAPSNFGASYTAEFRAAFGRLAREKRVALVPFLLDGVGGVAALNQADGIHPNAEGARRVADNVWAGLQPLLDATATR
jgi:acyl-CoA thioesterase-1